jgi:hypothetical protein
MAYLGSLKTKQDANKSISNRLVSAGEKRMLMNSKIIKYLENKSGLIFLLFRKLLILIN